MYKPKEEKSLTEKTLFLKKNYRITSCHKNPLA